MTKEELANKVIADVKAAPQQLEGVKKEMVTLFHRIVIDNAEQILKLDTEDDFYDFLAIVLDELIILPQPAEILDRFVIRLLLKKIVDPILDKYAPGGEGWYEKLKQFVAIKELESIDK